MFFVKTQRTPTPTQTDTTILSVYSLSLVTIIAGHLILTKIRRASVLYIFSRVSDKVTVLGKRQLCVVKCKRKDLLSTSIVGKINFNQKNVFLKFVFQHLNCVICITIRTSMNVYRLPPKSALNQKKLRYFFLMLSKTLF
jgi:hypothetical protein